jgi:hypothetical protein
MTKWQDFQQRTKDTPEWEVKATDALWTDGDTIAYVFIYVPINTLDPMRERIALLNQDIIFCCHFLSEGQIMYNQVKKFADAWNDLWNDLDEPPKIVIEDAPPEDFRNPTSLEWTPDLLRIFPSYQVSKSSYAPLWGQHVSYFGELFAELNSNPIQILDSKIKYNQTWVEQKFRCPFCKLQNPASVEAHSLREPEEKYYDPNSILLALICPKCERFVEVISRQKVEEMV